jgi:hypothetical protein
VAVGCGLPLLIEERAKTDARLGGMNREMEQRKKRWDVWRIKREEQEM